MITKYSFPLLVPPVDHFFRVRIQSKIIVIMSFQSFSLTHIHLFNCPDSLPIPWIFCQARILERTSCHFLLQGIFSTQELNLHLLLASPALQANYLPLSHEKSHSLVFLNLDLFPQISWHWLLEENDQIFHIMSHFLTLYHCFSVGAFKMFIFPQLTYKWKLDLKAWLI